MFYTLFIYFLFMIILGVSFVSVSLKHSTEKDWHSTLEAVIQKFAIMTIRMNRQINDQQFSHQTKRSLVFE